ncbi:hypothetical protein CKAN_00568100 [Cinnamomum micranthum f. kanehirae]|uniref:Uncharacterized protein n=1 Tax=Cinnamomum micranthum f. kanehirae TaxID=337451 RepID=A0A3S3Q0U7_9MAGN|nr:hypothetical protein CKAN_00568100 [Cinnamomum micranthum f. kanehirae]
MAHGAEDENSNHDIILAVKTWFNNCSVEFPAYIFLNSELVGLLTLILDASDRSRMQIWGFRSAVFVGALALSTSHHQKSSLLEVLTSKLHSQIMENYMHRNFLL